MKSQSTPCIVLRTAVLIAALNIFASALALDDNSAREIKNINDSWLFTFEGDSSISKVHLPHCWNVDAYETTNYRRGEGTYKRTLTIPASMAGKCVWLKFDGAASASSVIIDGCKIGTHTGAYSPNLLDISPYVSVGKSHDLTVKLTNADKDVPPHSADFTFMGGLYRDAWLIGLSPLHLDIASGPSEGFKATPRLHPDGTCSLSIDGRVVNQSGSHAFSTVVATLCDEDGEIVAERQNKLSIPFSGSKEFRIDFDFAEELKLWSPASPALYKLKVKVLDDKNKITDGGETFVGFRNFGFDNDGRFLINGTPLKLRGMCRHQDQYPMGIALSDAQHRRDMQLIKDMGANFIRISHYPQDDAILEMCDRLGIIAWEEIPVIDYLPDNEAFNANAESMLREMIRSHYNHPSVAMWGYMNEILLRTPGNEKEATYTRTLNLAHNLERVLHEEDFTRLSTMAFHGNDIYYDTGLAEITDVKGWNLYQGWYGGQLQQFEADLSRRHREHPSHPMIISEYGAGSDLRLHSFDPEPFDFSVEYQQMYLEHYLPVIEDSTFVAGASHWNFIDFSSANRAEAMPHINNKGLATNSRRKKDVYNYFRAAWHTLSEDTVAHIAVRDWPERTDISSVLASVNHPIKIYANLPEVSMRINGTNMPPQKVLNYNTVFNANLRNGANIIELFDCSVPAPRLLDATTIEMKLLSARDGRLDLGTDEFAVNVGSSCYFHSDDTGITWLPDREYSPGTLYGHVGGQRIATQDEISLTRYTPLLQHSLTGLDSYRFDVVPGSYEIELSFVDTSSPQVLSAYMLGYSPDNGAMLPVAMDIGINGCSVERNFKPGVEAGAKTMICRRYTAEVDADGILSIHFSPAGGITSLSAIKIRKL